MNYSALCTDKTSLVRRAGIWDCHVADCWDLLTVKSSSKGGQRKGDQVSDDLGTHLSILFHATESISRESFNNGRDKLVREQLINGPLESNLALITSHASDSWSSTHIFCGAHPLSIRVEIPRPQDLSDLIPEGGKFLNAFLWVLRHGADFSNEDLHLVTNRIPGSKICGEGHDNSLAVLAGGVRGG